MHTTSATNACSSVTRCCSLCRKALDKAPHVFKVLWIYDFEEMVSAFEAGQIRKLPLLVVAYTWIPDCSAPFPNVVHFVCNHA